MFLFKNIHFQRLQVSVVQLLQLTLLLPIYECRFTSPYWSVPVLPVQENHMKLGGTDCDWFPLVRGEPKTPDTSTAKKA